MSEYGVDRLQELSFFRIRLETLSQDIHDVIHQSPQKCVLAYADLSTRFKTVSEVCNMMYYIQPVQVLNVHCALNRIKI